jgi:hypothetical protein
MNAYQTLKYLWAIIQGYGRLTPLTDLDLSSKWEDLCEEKLEEANFLLSNKTTDGAGTRPAGGKDVGTKPRGRRDPDDSDGSLDSDRPKRRGETKNRRSIIYPASTLGGVLTTK